MLTTGLFWLLLALSLSLLAGVEFWRAPKTAPATTADAWTAVIRWLVLAGAFGVAVYFVYETNWLELRTQVSAPVDRQELRGEAAMLQFFGALAVELALSLDNVAVLVLLLAHYRVPIQQAARLIYLGSLASLAIRAGLVVLVGHVVVPWAHSTAVLAGLLSLALLRTLLMPERGAAFDGHWAVRLVRSVVTIRDHDASEEAPRRLWRRIGKRLVGTRLLLVIAVAGILDLVYAIDSVPAMFTVTRDPFLAFAAAAFALLSLRSMYFALRGVTGRFRFVRLAVAVILGYLIANVVVAGYAANDALRTILVVVPLAALGVGASVVRHRVLAPTADDARPTPVEDLAEAVYAARRNLRKIAVLIAGTFVVLFGAVVVGPIPGPGGSFVVAGGLALLATEFVWARRLLQELRRKTEELARKTDEAAKTMSWLTVVGVLAAFVLTAVMLMWVSVRWLPGFVQAFVMMTALGGSTFVGAWAGKSVYVMARQRRGGKPGRAEPANAGSDSPPPPAGSPGA